MESTNADLLVLGLGGTVDYEISWDNRIVEELVDLYKIGLQDLTKSEAISSERELVCTVLSYTWLTLREVKRKSPTPR